MVPLGGSYHDQFTIFLQATSGGDPRLYDPDKAPTADDDESNNGGGSKTSSATATPSAATITRKGMLIFPPSVCAI